MSEYWKSIPKKYCDFCKCYITDNKASQDFHERGFRHQGNVRKRVKEIQKNSTIQEREKLQYDSEIAKIEAAALNSFQSDLTRDPTFSKEISNKKTISTSSLEKSSEQEKTGVYNRFGQSFGDESEVLVNGKKRALETIAKSFEKKTKWLEAKTAEGSTYYWNKHTLETRYDVPKSGFLSLAEQSQFKNIPSSSHAKNDDFTNLSYHRCGWTTVEKQQNDEHKIIDLQLPSQDVSQIVLDIKQSSTEENDTKNGGEDDPIVFQEKTVADFKKPTKSTEQNVSFKKRTNVKRNIRSRDESN